VALRFEQRVARFHPHERSLDLQQLRVPRVQQAADEHTQAKLLMTQPGVGPNTALAFVLTIGDVSRFRRGKQVTKKRVSGLERRP